MVYQLIMRTSTNNRGVFLKYRIDTLHPELYHILFTLKQDMDADHLIIIQNTISQKIIIPLGSYF